MLFFKYLIDTNASFVWTYECRKCNKDSILYKKYDRIPYNLHSQKEKRLLVTDSRIKYDFLIGVDDVKWEFPFENGKYKPDVSLVHEKQLMLPFEIYFSNEDSEAKTAWYETNNYNVVKIDVSTTSGVTVDDIRALRKDWDDNKNLHAIFNQLNVSIICNQPIICLIPQILTTIEMLHDDRKVRVAMINRRLLEIEEQERREIERVRNEEERIKRKILEAQSRINSNKRQQVEVTTQNNVENEIKRTDTTKMEARIREIHTMVKTKIRDNTALNDPVIVSAIRRCRFTINDISHNLDGNSALRSALVLNIYNNQ